MYESVANKIEYVPRETANLRSLGGLAVDGGHIKERRLWRSDSLIVSPKQQLAMLKHEGLATAIDLRALDEVHLNWTPVLKQHEITYLHRPLTKKAADPKALARTFSTITTAEDVGDWYFKLMKSRAPILVSCLEDIASIDGGVAFYCAAGKDRTGVLAATILLTLGASSEVIIEDYTKTNRVMSNVLERLNSTSRNSSLASLGAEHPLLYAHPESMQRFLKLVREAGGIEAILTDRRNHKGDQPNSLKEPDINRDFTTHDIAVLRERLKHSLVQ